MGVMSLGGENAEGRGIRLRHEASRAAWAYKRAKDSAGQVHLNAR